MNIVALSDNRDLGSGNRVVSFKKKYFKRSGIRFTQLVKVKRVLGNMVETIGDLEEIL